MKNKLLLSGVLAALALTPFISGAHEGEVLAQNTEVNADASVGANTNQIKTRADIEARNKAIEEKRKSLQAEIEAKKATFKTEMEAKRETFQKEIEAKRDSIKTDVAAKKDAIKTAVDERRENAVNSIRDRVSKFLQHITERFGAAVERLDILAVRIDSRISKLEEEKIDVTKSKELMVAAKAKIEIAKTSVAGITLEVNPTASTTDSIKKDFEAIRSKIEAAKGDIKEAHAALIEVVRNLKPGQLRLEAKMKGNATTTATTTIDNNN